MRREGWHRALDVQMDTRKWCASPIGIELNARFFRLLVEKLESPVYKDVPSEVILQGARTTAHDMQILLHRADTCYITRDMMHVLVQAAHDLPDEACWDAHTLLTPRGFCLFEEPLYGEDRSGLTMVVSALLWDLAPINRPNTELEEAIHVFFFASMHDDHDAFNPEVRRLFAESDISVPPLHLSHWYPAVVGQPIWRPERNMPGSEITRETLKLFMAFQLLAQQSIGEPMRMRPDRASRKRFMRENPDEPERLITLITLRRKSVKKDDHEPEHIERTHRWIVRGHWRRQWYPKAKRHDWKYIYEHIKGPEDKPLRITERRVFNFRR